MINDAVVYAVQTPRHVVFGVWKQKLIKLMCACEVSRPHNEMRSDWSGPETTTTVGQTAHRETAHGHSIFMYIHIQSPYSVCLLDRESNRWFGVINRTQPNE